MITMLFAVALGTTVALQCNFVDEPLSTALANAKQGEVRPDGDPEFPVTLTFVLPRGQSLIGELREFEIPDAVVKSESQTIEPKARWKGVVTRSGVIELYEAGSPFWIRLINHEDNQWKYAVKWDGTSCSDPKYGDVICLGHFGSGECIQTLERRSAGGESK